MYVKLYAAQAATKVVFLFGKIMSKQETIATLKEKYVTYFTDVPIQKYAAMFIGRDEDTIIRWRKEDTDFADAVQRARAEWVRKKVLATKAEFALERLEKAVFSASYTEPVNERRTAPLIDPNDPEMKKINEQITNLLMERTKREEPDELPEEPEPASQADRHPSTSRPVPKPEVHRPVPEPVFPEDKDHHQTTGMFY